jgi:hypothetical protein
MPMVASDLQSKFYNTIYNNLKSQMGSTAQQGTDYEATADQFWQKLATALSAVAVDIVTEIQQNATVVPGQQVVTAGSPTPGMIT